MRRGNDKLLSFFANSDKTGTTLLFRSTTDKILNVKETGKKGFTDIEQLKYASSQNRVIFTHNIADFNKTHSDFIKKGLDHSGIILSKQLPIGVIVKALLKLFANLNYEKVGNNII